jgi:hypothetical protein
MFPAYTPFYVSFKRLDFSENDFLSKEIDEKKEWFFRTFLKLKINKLRNDYCKYMDEIKENVKFF